MKFRRAKGGLRIHHPTLRDAVILVPLPPKTREGSAKEVQVVIDADGYALVSAGVWDELKFAAKHGGRHGFTFANEVAEPPTQVLFGQAADMHRRTFRAEADAVREIAPVGVTTRIIQAPPPSLRST